jgi:hypothetical protein
MSDLKLELTLEQKLEIERLKRLFKQMSKEDLERQALGYAKLQFSYLNAYKSVFKKDIL